MTELSKNCEDPKLKSEVMSLATHELEDFEFLLGMNIWYDILFAVNSISKISTIKIYAYRCCYISFRRSYNLFKIL